MTYQAYRIIDIRPVPPRVVGTMTVTDTPEIDEFDALRQYCEMHKLEPEGLIAREIE